MDNYDIFVKADGAHENGDYALALDLFMQCAKNGDVYAMERIASMYTCGEGVECSYDNALEWELKAYNAGHSSAAINIGITYRIKGDLVNSRKWLKKAFAGGDDEAALLLAKLHIVCGNQTEKVVSLLNKVITSTSACRESIDEAKSLLANLR